MVKTAEAGAQGAGLEAELPFNGNDVPTINKAIVIR
jgi:hypothetical protein